MLAEIGDAGGAVRPSMVLPLSDRWHGLSQGWVMHLPCAVLVVFVRFSSLFSSLSSDEMPRHE